MGSGGTSVLLAGRPSTLTYCAVNLGFQTQRDRSRIQRQYRRRSPSIGWTKSRVKGGSLPSCPVTTQGGFAINVKV